MVSDPLADDEHKPDMTLRRRFLFYALRVMDDLWPGWAAPRADLADYLTDESRSFWLTQHYRGGEHD